MKTIKDFGHFNELPEGCVLVTENEFYLRFFMYCIGGELYRQPRNIGDGILCDGEHFSSIRMFPLSYAGCEKIGYGLAQVYHSKNCVQRVAFFKFGSADTWVKLQTEMAAQFAGDNS